MPKKALAELPLFQLVAVQPCLAEAIPPLNQLALVACPVCPDGQPTEAILPPKSVSVAAGAGKTDEKVEALFTGMLAWALAGPVTFDNHAIANGDVDYLLPMHAPVVHQERLLLAMRFWGRARSMAPADVLREGQDIMQRLTDREVCMILSELSFLAPLDSECAHEYLRAFAASSGLDAFLTLQGAWFEAINPEYCKQLRCAYPKARATFPLLDPAEIDRFNRAARAAFEARQAAPPGAGVKT
jgi:hypothetical protein